MRLAYGECPTYGMLFICVFSVSISLSFVAPPPPAVFLTRMLIQKLLWLKESFRTDLRYSEEHKNQAK